MLTFEQKYQRNDQWESISYKYGKQGNLASARPDERRKSFFSQLETTVLSVVTGSLYHLLVPGLYLGKRSIRLGY